MKREKKKVATQQFYGQSPGLLRRQPPLHKGSRKTVFLQNRLKKGREVNNIKGFGAIFHAEFLRAKWIFGVIFVGVSVKSVIFMDLMQFENIRLKNKVNEIS